MEYILLHEACEEKREKHVEVNSMVAFAAGHIYPWMNVDGLDCRALTFVLCVLVKMTVQIVENGCL